MDFQRLFKRREESPGPSMTRVNNRDLLNSREVLVREGELLEGKTPAALEWSSVGGTINLKAEKILGILEGRTRVKAAVLQELYPGLFQKSPNPGTEYNIPLRAVIMQLEEMFTSLPVEEAEQEDFETPFGLLAIEDETRLRNQPVAVQEPPPPPVSPKLVVLAVPNSEENLKEPDSSENRENPAGEISTLGERSEDRLHSENNLFDDLPAAEEKLTIDQSETVSLALEKKSGQSGGLPKRASSHLGSYHARVEPSERVGEESSPESRGYISEDSSFSSSLSKSEKKRIRREGHDSLQGLYLTDEPLDGSKVADLILQLPRVAAAVIMLSDGAALGGGLNGGLSEALLTLTADFVKRVLDFTACLPGGPAKFSTFAGQTGLISLTTGGNVFILASHEGKNLPPGLSERLMATAQALNMIYGFQP
jgi:hypothetical protein